MLEKIEKYGMLIMGIILLLLFLLSSTDLIWKENRSEVSRISIVIDDTDDSAWTNFKKGMDQAAARYQVEISFATLYDTNGYSSQQEQIQREIEDGTDAMVIAPFDAENIARYLDETALSIPVEAIISDIPSEKTGLNLIIDSYQMGYEMGGRILDDSSQVQKVIAVTSNKNKESAETYYQGLMGRLQEADIPVTLKEVKSEQEVQDLFDASNPEKMQVMVGTDATVLNRICGEAVKRQMEKLQLYGNGYTNRTLRYMEEDRIQALTICNDYNLGYLCLENMVYLLRKENRKGRQMQPFYLIGPEELNSTEYQYVLYPIE
ncbi:substrate-binding domain-containing protein [Diplocloster hominis]|uniref:substrate-binding domain-containing protein n=1 Tax=Diplocloster hominis TaxID=3079010 RepID=UPI0031BAC082